MKKNKIAYIPLTKIVVNENNEEMAVCRFYGTDKCRTIHSECDCSSCSFHQSMMIQFNALEEWYASKYNK